MGAPSTGKKVRIDCIDVWKIKNGKAVENWVSMDNVAMMTPAWFNACSAHETA